MSLQEQQAKVSAAEQELANIRSQYDAIESQQKAASDAAERARANLLASGIDPATDENYQQLAQQSSQLSRQAQGLGNSLARARQNLAIANESLRREQQNQTIKNNATSSGAVVAAGDDAGVVNPAKKAERITPEGRIANPNPAGTNADAPVTNTTEQGATVSESQDRKISETQLPIKAPNQGEVKRLVDEPPPDPLTPPPGAYGSGVGSAGDDATPTKNLTRQDIELNFNEDIRPQPNILDKYATYTYQISW
jgi:multidrug efflux pump subunit AcrA (membrane-fusion protein)